MRTEKELKAKIEELREKAFDLMEANQTRAVNKRVSIRTLRLVIDALEFSMGNKEDLMLLTEKYNQKENL